MKKFFALAALALTTSCHQPYQPTDNTLSLLSLKNHINKRHFGPTVAVSVSVSPDSTLWHIQDNKEEIVTIDFDKEHIKQAREANENIFRVTVMCPVNLPDGQTQPTVQSEQMGMFENSNDVLTVFKRNDATLDLMTMFINGGSSELAFKSDRGLVKFVKMNEEALVQVTPAPFSL